MKINPFKKRPVQPSTGGLPSGYDNRLTDISSSAQAATYNGFPTYSGFPGAVWNPYSGNIEKPASPISTTQVPVSMAPVAADNLTVLPIDDAPVAGIANDPNGSYDVPPPAGSVPDPFAPGNYVYGGKGGGDTKDGVTIVDVYDQNGQKLGTDSTYYKDDKAFQYGVDFGGTTPPLDANHQFVAPATGGASVAGGNIDFSINQGLGPTYVAFPTGGASGSPTYSAFPTVPTYAAFPGAGITSQTVPLTPSQIASGMGDGDNPLHGGSTAVSGSVGSTYNGFPTASTFHPPNAATSAAKTEDMFSVAPSPTYAAFPAAGAPTPAWQTANLNSLNTPIQTSSLESHGMGLMMRDSKDGQKEIVQMTDGTYESIDKKTGAVASAGTWGDGHGGGVALNGIGLSSVGLPDNGNSTPAVTATDFHPPSAVTSAAKSEDMFALAPAPTYAAFPSGGSSTPSYVAFPGPVAGGSPTDAVDRFTNNHSAAPRLAASAPAAIDAVDRFIANHANAAAKSDDMFAQAPATPAATTAPTTTFNAPSAATAAAKSDDMFAQAPAAAPTSAAPASTDAVDRFLANHASTPTPAVQPKLTLPKASPHDLPLGGGLGGLDPSSSAHKYMGRH